MELRKEGFEVPVFISHLPNHEEIRDGLLEIIDELDAPAWTENGIKAQIIRMIICFIDTPTSNTSIGYFSRGARYHI